MDFAIGCEHYQRKCQLVAPCCGEVFWCRHCHNVAKNDDEPVDESRRHVLDRKTVKEVVCAICHFRQPVGASCLHCGTVFGRYFCLECKFYDDDIEKQQFHCDRCGICRIGGRQNFFHCDTCACCYHVDIQNVHVCVRNSMQCNCPICQEFLFDSIREIQVLSCGHTIHKDCYRQLLKHSYYKCPVCSRSVGDMSVKWQQMDVLIATNPMPVDLRHRSSLIGCNDCHETSNVPYHIVGHKCGTCGGYNTFVLQYTDRRRVTQSSF